MLGFYMASYMSNSAEIQRANRREPRGCFTASIPKLASPGNSSPHHSPFPRCFASFLTGVVLACFAFIAAHAESPEPARTLVQARLQGEYSALFDLYKQLHAAPELSLQEEKTAARFAKELRQAGFEITTGVGGHGVVGVLRNGTGPTVLVRTDMDALPVKEETGLPYASTVTFRDSQGRETPAMHACGHDMHMTCALGTARVLSSIKECWNGTLIVIGQPAEEIGGGARAMLADGLFTRFPRPDFCLALHVNAELPAGVVGYTPGCVNASVDSVDILVKGVGGHGAYPHKTKDPVVLSAQIILALQTIVSREIQPTEPAVVTVGSIHGGSKPNIIPDEVRLQLTIRTHSDEVREQTLEAIRRIARGQAEAAGMPADKMPEVTFSKGTTPAVFNDVELTERLAGVFQSLFGQTNVVRRKPGMGGEDFAEYGRTNPKVPICIFSLGTIGRTAGAENQASTPPPSLHSPLYAPVPEASIKTGVTAMCGAVLELMKTNSTARTAKNSSTQSTQAGTWKAGTARSRITPELPMWLAGYAARTRPAEGKATDLWLKALALEDATGHRAVIITTDLLAIRGSLYRSCLPRLKEKYGLDVEQVFLTAAHTHCAPLLPNRVGSLSMLDQAEQEQVNRYVAELEDKIVLAAGEALASLEPVTLVAGQGASAFAANRRNNTEEVRKASSPDSLVGPVEHSVPVLAAIKPSGEPVCILFSYACHNTTMTADFCQYCGDYAGFAQASIESKHPNATAMFFIGCAGDQDPVVRGELDLARRYGSQLAESVEGVLRNPASPLAPSLVTRMETIPLKFGPAPTEEELEKYKKDPTPYVRRWATNILAEMKSGKPLERSYPYPLQVWRFGQQQTLITLGGEPVVDYAIKFKREFGEQTWVAGYANDVMCYIPSLRVLNEDKPPLAKPNWGYEGSQAMKVLGLPALRWADDVEDTISAAVKKLVQQACQSQPL